MQLLNIVTNSIALFGFGYFLIALAAHLWHCWVNPLVKTTTAESFAPVKELNLLEFTDPYKMPLLPPDAGPHPWELALEKMSALGTISAVHLPAVAVHSPHVAVAPLFEVEAIELASLSSTALRAICSERGIRWRGVKHGKHLSKPEMLAALTA